MTYVEGEPKDERLHRSHHDRVVCGVRARRSKSEHVIWQSSDARITLVDAESPLTLHRRAAKVARLANLETQYDCGMYDGVPQAGDRDLHLFLYHAGPRILGLIMVEMRNAVLCYRWRSGMPPEGEELQRHRPMRTVVFAWIHKTVRGRGLGRLVLLEAVRYFGMDLQGIAWYPPFSPSGAMFVRRMCPHKFYTSA